MATTDEKPTRTSVRSSDQAFVSAVWEDLAVVFTEHFGTRWTSAVQQEYQTLQQLAMRLTTLASGAQLDTPPEPQLTRILSHYTRGRS